jgi:uncharacterized protein (TIGR02145 family)
MAQNLNYSKGVDSSWCYANSSDSCTKYGRLYQWAAVMGLDPKFDTITWNGSIPNKGICPTGWQVPSDSDWTELIRTVDPTNQNAGRILSANVPGWNGTDNFGFGALPGGQYLSGTFYLAGSYMIFWSSSEIQPTTAEYYANGDRPYITYSDNPKLTGYSLRCIGD